MLVFAFIVTFVVGGCFGMVLTALLAANDSSRGHPL